MARMKHLAVIDAGQRNITPTAHTRNAPFAVAVAPRHGMIFVSNRGGRIASQQDVTAPSSGTAVVTDPVTGSTVSGTVSAIQAKTGKVTEIAVGLAPSL